eukprot:m.39391 g.39391  ORF g.39391 m.39391 type:complete len:880 (-) comp9547_c0_seq2:217-2856(-)
MTEILSQSPSQPHNLEDGSMNYDEEDGSDEQDKLSDLRFTGRGTTDPEDKGDSREQRKRAVLVRRASDTQKRRVAVARADHVTDGGADETGSKLTTMLLTQGNLSDVKTRRYSGNDGESLEKIPLPPPESPPKQRPIRYKKILAGIPTWTSEMDKFHESRESRHLNNWKEASKTWKKTEGQLKARTGITGDRLCFNSLREHYAKKQTKDLVEQTTDVILTHTHPNGLHSNAPDLWPRLTNFQDQSDGGASAPKLTQEHLRDLRTGPEFWKQPEASRKMKLPLHVQYSHAVHEFVSRPTVIRSEMLENVEKGDASEEGSNRWVPYDSSLLDSLSKSTRLTNCKLPPVEAWIPDLDGLAVVGTGIGEDVEDTCSQFDSDENSPIRRLQREAPLTPWDRDGQVEETILEEDEGEDYNASPLTPRGPHITISGSDSHNLAKKNSQLDSFSCRTTFTSKVHVGCLSSVHLRNKGNTAVYYSWHRFKPANTLGIREDKIERFIFDRRPRVLLPGESRTLPVQFKSPSAGIYTEEWEITTMPVLKNTLRVTMSGTCLKHDEFKEERQKIEKDLEMRSISLSIQSLLYDIIHKIQPTPLPPPHVEPTKREIFLEANNKDGLEPVEFDERLVRKCHQMYELAWQQRWTQEHHPLPPPKIDLGPPPSAKGKGKDKGKSAPPPPDEQEETNAEPIVVPDAPAWDMSVASLKDVLLTIVDNQASKVSGKEWRTQNSYLEEYHRLTSELSELHYEKTQGAPEVTTSNLARSEVAADLLSKMMDRIVYACEQSRKMLDIPPQTLFIKPEEEPEVYVPRIDLTAVKGKKGKGGKDDKGKKDAKKGKTTEETPAVPPEPLTEDQASRLAPVEYQAVRQAVIDSFDEWDDLIPLTS